MRRCEKFSPPVVRFLTRKSEIGDLLHTSSNMGEFHYRSPSDRRIYINLRAAWSYIERKKSTELIGYMADAICLTIIHEALHSVISKEVRDYEEWGELDPNFAEGIIESLAETSLGRGVYTNSHVISKRKRLFPAARRLAKNWEGMYDRKGNMK